MIGLEPITIEPLNKKHNRGGFRCGIDALDAYLKRQASQDVKRNISQVFIATLGSDSTIILGFYTLSCLSIDVYQFADNIVKKLPKHPIPAALLGRLAVSVDIYGHGFGKMLLTDAIKRTIQVSNEIAIYAMVVEAINDEAKIFYEKYGFSCMSSHERRLYLPLKQAL